MRLVPIYLYQTRRGVAVIAFNPATQRFHAVFDEEDLGSYSSPQHAVDDLSGGHTFSHSSGIDTSTLGIPNEVGDWQRAR